MRISSRNLPIEYYVLDGEVHSGGRAVLVVPTREMKLVEQPGEFERRNPFALVEDLKANGLPVASGMYADGGTRWRLPRRILDQDEEDPSKDRRIEVESKYSHRPSCRVGSWRHL